MVCRMNIDHALRNALEKEAESTDVDTGKERRRQSRAAHRVIPLPYPSGAEATQWRW